MKEFLNKIKDLHNKVVKFITTDVWHLKIEDLGKYRKRLIRYLKVAIITIKEASSDKLNLYSISLSFFSAMAVVPFAAVAFVVTGGLGLERRLEELLLESFSGNQETLKWVIKFADNIITSSTQGIFGVISFVFFMGTVLWLILNIEKSFNDIWKVERGRSIAKRFLYYIGIMIIAPFLITIFLSVSLVFNDALKSIGYGIIEIESINKVLQWGLFFGIVLLMFTIMYKYIPNVKVHFIAAFNAALIAAAAFIVVQYLYMETQILVSRLNAIYGAFAAIPLFLIWMNVSWVIILFGAEISHAYQYVDSYTIDNNVLLKQEIRNKLNIKDED